MKIPSDDQSTFSPGQLAAMNCLGGPARYSNLVGGTRSGKTFLIVRAIVLRAIKGANSRHGIFRFRANAAKTSIAKDTLPTVMRKCFAGVPYETGEPEGWSVMFLPNGSEIRIGGLDDKDRVEKILGLEFSTIFLNEASQITYSAYLTAMTRLAQVTPGLKQRAFVDLNPVGKAHWTNLLFGQKIDPQTRRPLAAPEAYDRSFLNPLDNARNLDPAYIAGLQNMPEKQRKRFFEGVYVDEVDGALWTFEMLEQLRIDAISPQALAKIVIAIDPSGARGREDLGHDEIGLIVAAKGQDGHAYVLEDLSLLDGPAGWARVAVLAYHRWNADRIVAEVNYGGAMVESTIKAQDPQVPVSVVTASRGKWVRAEPIATLYAKGIVHHVGRHTKLEEQLTQFSTGGFQGPESPDRADAMIWALTDLMLGDDNTGMVDYYAKLAAASSGAPAPSERYHFGAKLRDIEGPTVPGQPLPGFIFMVGETQSFYAQDGTRYDNEGKGRFNIREEHLFDAMNAGLRRSTTHEHD